MHKRHLAKETKYLEVQILSKLYCLQRNNNGKNKLWITSAQEISIM